MNYIRLLRLNETFKNRLGWLKNALSHSRKKGGNLCSVRVDISETRTVVFTGRRKNKEDECVYSVCLFDSLDYSGMGVTNDRNTEIPTFSVIAATMAHNHNWLCLPLSDF